MTKRSPIGKNTRSRKKAGHKKKSSGLGRSALWSRQSAEMRRLFPHGILDKDAFYQIQTKGRCEICGKVGDIWKIKRLFKIQGRNEVRFCYETMKYSEDIFKKYFPDVKEYRLYGNKEIACRQTKGVDLDAWSRIFEKRPYYIDLLKRHDKAFRRCEREQLTALKESGAVKEYEQARKEVRLERKIRAAEARAFREFDEDGCITYEFRDEEAFKEMMVLYDELIGITKDPESLRLNKQGMRLAKNARKGLLKEKEERERATHSKVR